MSPKRTKRVLDFDCARSYIKLQGKFQPYNIPKLIASSGTVF